tara:strand:- start:1019 stop:1429 length:411 start_codon:yes stop_codon:yes gene_type:complete
MPSIKTSIEIGSAGEHLAMFEIYLAGYNAHLTSDQCKYDIIIDTSSNLIRTQVKTTVKPTDTKELQSFTYQIKRKIGNKAISYALEEFELYAFSCLPLRRVAFMPHKDVLNSHKVTIRLEEYNYYTLDRALKIILG